MLCYLLQGNWFALLLGNLRVKLGRVVNRWFWSCVQVLTSYCCEKCDGSNRFSLGSWFLLKKSFAVLEQCFCILIFLLKQHGVLLDRLLSLYTVNLLTLLSNAMLMTIVNDWIYVKKLLKINVIFSFTLPYSFLCGCFSCVKWVLEICKHIFTSAYLWRMSNKLMPVGECFFDIRGKCYQATKLCVNMIVLWVKRGNIMWSCDVHLVT